MQIVVKDAKVIATHDDGQDLADKYPGCEIASYSGPPPSVSAMSPTPDPRTPKQKAEAYKDQRKAAYPSIADQLEMLYNDTVNGTHTWVDAIAAVKTRYPKQKD